MPAAESAYSIAPAPAWASELPEGPAPVGNTAGVYFSAHDTQIHVEGENQTIYSRSVRVVDNVVGLGRAGQIQLSFDPAYQSITMHRLALIRGHQTLNRLDAQHIQVLHREAQLESLLYNGELTLSIVLDDVRVGDRIEYAYSIHGANPVFGGRVVADHWVANQTAPMSNWRLRLIAPQSRSIQYHAGSEVTVTSKVVNGERQTDFTRQNVAQLFVDAYAPESSYLDEQVQISEFKDWAAVVAWGRTLFDAGPDSDGTLRREVETLRAAGQTQEERLAAALDLVQTQVRYFGIEMGAGSHHPHSPAAVLEQRFGDCKDKVTLLIALLDGLGIEARPILVSTHYRDSVSQLLPSPLDFDHVIARVRLGDQTYFLDATRAYQGGPLPDRQPFGLGAGLVVDASTTGPSPLPGYEGRQWTSVDERIVVRDFTHDPELESRMTYTGLAAEAFRATVASAPLDVLQASRLTDYARFYPRIRATAPLEVEDHPESDSLTLVGHYVLPGFWHLGDDLRISGDSVLWSLESAVRLNSPPERTRAFRVSQVGSLHHRVRIEFPEDVNPSADEVTLSDSGVDFSYQGIYRTSPRAVEIDATLTVADGDIGVAQWPAYSEQLRRLRLRTFVHLPLQPYDRAATEELTRQVLARENAMRTGTFNFKIVDLPQVTAGVRELQLSALVSGHRMTDDVRAEALRQRGDARDGLGWFAQANQDFDQAVKLDPQDARAHLGLASNNFYRQQDASAISEAKRAIELEPSNPDAHAVLAEAQYFTNDFASSRNEFTRYAVTRPSTDRARAALWIYLAAQHDQKQGADAVQGYLATVGDAWPAPLLRYFTGSADFETTHKAAQAPKPDPLHICEFYFYAGEKALVDGDNAGARADFQNSVNAGTVGQLEYTLAARRLAQLSQSAASTQ